jgi:16S rRNA (adenine1518-N6/adenine1519-N6)-dimethyltransferase
VAALSDRSGRSKWVPAIALARAGVRPSKGRGQNFLVQPAVADRIVAAARLEPGDQVIEIGPGLGILSERIVAYPIARLAMVEIDSRLAADLKDRFQSAPKVEVIEADFLDLEPATVFRDSPAVVIGNLPFSSASAILRKLCDWRRMNSRQMISRMVLMFQREVAERIRARPGQPGYAMLSVVSALYWEIDSHFRITAGSFHPKPKVDAEVLIMRPRVPAPFADDEEHAVIETVRAAFSSRRKTLRNALSSGLKIVPARAQAALERAAIDPGARAETLDTAGFVRLTRALAVRTGDA